MKLRKKWCAGCVRLVTAIMVAGLGCIVASAAGKGAVDASSWQSQTGGAQTAAVRPVGAIKAISGTTITLTTDAGADVVIQVQTDAKLLRIAPGEKDLKNASPLQLPDLQVGDRILVRGTLGTDGKTVLAASVIAMKQADIATKQAHDREEWQRHGVGGLVTKIDAASGAITISTNAVGAAKDVTVQVTKQTMLRRYAPDSVKFDDAKAAALEQLKTGDQLRARGTRSADGSELTADEIVSGTFRNIAGTINSIDAPAGTISVTDLITKKPVTVKIAKDTQLRKLAPQMAQMIAARLKGGAPGGAASANGPGPAAARPADAGSGQNGAGGAAPSGTGGPGGGAGAGGRSGDFQQALSRMPAATLADLQKGDAVMIVTTEGTQENGVTAITLLAGVEPLLQASSNAASTILTPWSLSGAPGGDAAP